MALAAVCPQCSTRFRVVADQLKLKHGWVRCGSCGFAFNAVERLTYVPDDTIVMRRSAMDELLARRSQDTAVADASVAAASTAPAAPKSRFPIGPDAQFEAASRESAAPSPGPVAAPADAVLPWPELKDEKDDGAKQAAPTALTDSAVAARPALTAAPAPHSEPEASAPADVEQVEAAPPPRRKEKSSAPPADSEAYELHTIIELDESRERSQEYMLGPAEEMAAQFLRRDAEEAARARRINRVSAFGATVAAIALAGQLSYTFRNELAVKAPGSVPVLNAMCEVAGCTIELPAHANVLSLDSLQLAQVGASDLYQATALIKNTSSMTQRAPHLELTLTRVNGDLVARRVLAPKDWLPARVVTQGLPASGETVAQFSLQVDKGPSGINAFSGFGGALFYPAP
ncbi:MAG: DUF3426 domain-containing protein [Burkholderiaceae bacterium]